MGKLRDLFRGKTPKEPAKDAPTEESGELEIGGPGMVSFKIAAGKDDIRGARRLGRRIVELFEKEGIEPDRATMIALAMILHTNTAGKIMDEGSKNQQSPAEKLGKVEALAPPPGDVTAMFEATKPGLMTNVETGEKQVMVLPPKLRQ